MPVRMTKEGRASTREEYRYEQKEKAKKEKFLTGGQAKLAAKAPPPNKIDEKDFAVLRAEKAKGRGMGLQDEKVKPGKVQKAVLGKIMKGVGSGLGKLMGTKKTAESTPGGAVAGKGKFPINLVEQYKKAKGLRRGGVTKAALGLAFMKKAKDKGAKGAEFLSPIAMAKRMFNKKAGGVMKYKKGSGLNLPVIDRVKPAVHKSKKAQKTAVMKEQFNKQKSRSGQNPNKSPESTKSKAVSGIKSGIKTLGKAGRVGAVGAAILSAGYGAAKLGQTIGRKMSEKKDVKKKMGGGMMMQRPMGYKYGTSVTAKCKLGRNKPTKIT